MVSFFRVGSSLNRLKVNFLSAIKAIGCSPGADNASNLASSVVDATRQRAARGLDRIEHSLVVISVASSNGFRSFVETYVIVTIVELAFRYEVTTVLEVPPGRAVSPSWNGDCR